MKDVAYTDFSTNEPVLVPLTITGMAQGPRILLQKVILLMFTDSRGDARYTGGGLYASYKGANMPVAGKTDLIDNFVQSAIKTVEDEIKAYQQVQTDLPDNEKLSSIRLDSIVMTADSVSAVITITTVSGETATASTTL